MINGITLELCAGSLRDCRLAEQFPIDRIELNCALELGGLTPSFSTFLTARKESFKKIICMVRPRPAGFLYDGSEVRTMIRDAELFLENRADGIAFGFLNQNSTIDTELTGRMCSLCHSYGKEAVFHMAFDLTPDPFRAAEKLIGCGVDRILTRGQAESAAAGTPLIAQLNAFYGDQIQILPGGGISADNAPAVIRESGSRQIHFSAGSAFFDSGEYRACDPVKIGAIIDSLRIKKGTDPFGTSQFPE